MRPQYYFLSSINKNACESRYTSFEDAEISNYSEL